MGEGLLYEWKEGGRGCSIGFSGAYGVRSLRGESGPSVKGGRPAWGAEGRSLHWRERGRLQQEEGRRPEGLRGQSQPGRGLEEAKGGQPPTEDPPCGGSLS